MPVNLKQSKCQLLLSSCSNGIVACYKVRHCMIAGLKYYCTYSNRLFFTSWLPCTSRCNHEVKLKYQLLSYKFTYKYHGIPDDYRAADGFSDGA